MSCTDGTRTLTVGELGPFCLYREVMICLATPRLLLRTWQAEDCDDLDILLHPATPLDPDSLLGGASRAVGNLRRVADMPTPLLIQSLNEGWDRDGFGLFAVETLDRGRLCGVAGLAPDDSRARSLELVWRIGPPTGSTRASDDDLGGLAVEALRASIDWAFGVLDVEAISATFADDNVNAMAVVAAVGLVPADRSIDPVTSGWLQRHSITLTAWNAEDQ